MSADIDMGADVDVAGLTWRPLRRRRPVLDGLTLHVSAGQRVLLAGPSGAGKSTLLRAVAGVLEVADAGERRGTVRIGGHPVGETAHRSNRGGDGPLAGLLLQDPTAGTVAATVGRDVAFGLENQRVEPDRIWARVREVLAATGFPYGPGHPSGALSGGEAQRLALAGALVLDAPVLLLDEPTSMLDPAAAAQVRAAVRAASEATRPTVIVAEHDLEPWLDFADRMIVLDAEGQVAADGPPADVLARHSPALAAQGVWVPGLAAPTVRPLDARLVEPWQPVPGVLVRAGGVTVRLGRRTAGRRAPRETLAVDAVDAAITAGRVLAATGPSGAGKSTLLSVLAGLRRPTAGTVLAAPGLAPGGSRGRRAAGGRGLEPWRWASPDLAARIAWAPQLPEHGVVARTVRDEVLASGRACGRDGRRLAERADGLLAALGLDHLAAASPYHLSGGEQRRLMLAAALAHGPSVLALDEPTVGQDRTTWAAVAGAIAGARGAGAGVALASHDARAVAALADDRLTLRSGAGGTGVDGLRADGRDASRAGPDGHGADGHGADGHGANGRCADGTGAAGTGVDGSGARPGVDGSGVAWPGVAGPGVAAPASERPAR